MTVAGTVAVAGCLGGGYDPEAVKAEAEPVPYEEMSEGDRIYVERGQVRQVQIDGTRYFISTEQEDDEWINDIFGEWDGDEFEEDEIVELWGVVEGTMETEEGRTFPDVTIVDMQAAD